MSEALPKYGPTNIFGRCEGSDCVLSARATCSSCHGEFCLSHQDHAIHSAAMAGNPPVEVVLTMPEAMDFETQDQVLRTCHEVLNTSPGVTSVVLDLSRVTFADSSGVSAIVLIRSSAAKIGAETRLRHVSPAVLTLLRTAAVDRIVVIDS